MFLAAFFISVAAAAAAARRNSPLPTVDLGYTLQQATTRNDTGGYYNFTNIRYAAPPVGNLRFAAPIAPEVNRTVQTGTIDPICFQAVPLWSATSAQFVPAYLSGNVSSLNFSTPSTTSVAPQASPPRDPRETEDCLFLDVVVPREVFECRNKTARAPVVVWIHGGGYVSGSKYLDGAAGLIARSRGDEAPDGIVLVAINYRLGAFGWLAGSTVAGNAGLLDQRLALEWVQRNVHLFGGDNKRVTVMGESAGGGSIVHQITAYGGTRPVPFQKAIVQSPGWVPTPRQQLERVLQEYLRFLNVSTVDEARRLPAVSLRDANSAIVGGAAYGGNNFGPVVDGGFVPRQPEQLLSTGAFAKDVKVMAASNINEGLAFTSPFVRDNAAYISLLRGFIADASPELVDYASQTLYPPIFNGSFGYRDQFQRAAQTVSDAIFTCSANLLARAYGNATYDYLFAIPPGLHAQDVPYTFFNGPDSANRVVEGVAVALQDYLTNFAAAGDPNGPGLPRFEMYGSEKQVLSLAVERLRMIKDPAVGERCLFWQRVRAGIV